MAHHHLGPIQNIRISPLVFLAYSARVVCFPWMISAPTSIFIPCTKSHSCFTRPPQHSFAPQATKFLWDRRHIHLLIYLLHLNRQTCPTTTQSYSAPKTSSFNSGEGHPVGFISLVTTTEHPNRKTLIIYLKIWP